MLWVLLMMRIGDLVQFLFGKQLAQPPKPTFATSCYYVCIDGLHTRGLSIPLEIVSSNMHELED